MAKILFSIIATRTTAKIARVNIFGTHEVSPNFPEILGTFFQHRLLNVSKNRGLCGFSHALFLSRLPALQEAGKGTTGSLAAGGGRRTPLDPLQSPTSRSLSPHNLPAGSLQDPTCKAVFISPGLRTPWLKEAFLQGCLSKQSVRTLTVRMPRL